SELGADAIAPLSVSRMKTVLAGTVSDAVTPTGRSSTSVAPFDGTSAAQCGAPWVRQPRSQVTGPLPSQVMSTLPAHIGAHPAMSGVPSGVPGGVSIVTLVSMVDASATPLPPVGPRPRGSKLHPPTAATPTSK